MPATLAACRSASSTISPAANRSVSTAASSRSARISRHMARMAAAAASCSCRSRGVHAASHVASCSRNSARSSSGRRKKVRPQRPCRMPLSAERALPASLAGPDDLAPFRREASDWAGEGVAGMAQAPGLEPVSLSRKRALASRNLRLSPRPPSLQPHAWRRNGRQLAAPRAGLRLDKGRVLLMVEIADTSPAFDRYPRSPSTLSKACRRCGSWISSAARSRCARTGVGDSVSSRRNVAAVGSPPGCT